MPRFTWTALLFMLAAPLRAQCPDGTPPPCSRSRAAPSLSVAVLTFDNLSHDTSDTYLAEGLANDISAQLSQVRRLAVTSRSMVRRAPADAAPPALGRALNASYLVTGGVQRSAGRVRISVELVRAATAQTVWSDQYDRTIADLLQVQQQIAGSVVTGIAGRLLPGERTILAATPARASDAYDHVLRGDFLLVRRSLHDVERALDEYQAAIQLDLGSARAWASLGNAFGVCADWGFQCRHLRGDSLRVLGMQAVARAITLDSNLALAYKARQTIEYDLHPAAGLRDIERAIALDPANENYRTNRAWMLAEELRFDEARAELQRSVLADPSRPIAWEMLSRLFIVARRYPEALAALDSALRLEPGLVPAWQRRADLRAFLGDRAGANADAAQAAHLDGDSTAGAAQRAAIDAWARASAGDTASAHVTLDSLAAAHAMSYSAFILSARLGQAAGGLSAMLQDPTAEWDPFWASYPYFDPIRDDPSFRTLQDRYRRRRAITP